jgi:putative endonuclease
MSRTYYVYILASKRNGTLYIGVTNNLERRIYEHKNKLMKGFTSEYNINQLVYYEHTNSIESALQREKALKVWKRAWKIKLIESNNPPWSDLSLEFFKTP